MGGQPTEHARKAETSTVEHEHMTRGHVDQEREQSAGRSQERRKFAQALCGGEEPCVGVAIRMPRPLYGYCRVVVEHVVNSDSKIICTTRVQFPSLEMTLHLQLSN